MWYVLTNDSSGVVLGDSEGFPSSASLSLSSAVDEGEGDDASSLTKGSAAISSSATSIIPCRYCIGHGHAHSLAWNIVRLVSSRLVYSEDILNTYHIQSLTQLYLESCISSTVNVKRWKVKIDVERSKEGGKKKRKRGRTDRRT